MILHQRMSQRCSLLLLVAALGHVAVGSIEAKSTSMNVTDLVSRCRHVVSFGIRFPNETGMHKAVLTLSTGAMIHKSLLVVTDSEVGSHVPCVYQGVNTATGEAVFGHETSGVLRSRFKSQGHWYRTKKSIHSPEPAVAVPADLDEEGLETAVLKERRAQHLPDGTLVKQSEVVGGHSRRKRSLKLESFNNAAARKVLELVVVAESGYVSKFGSGTVGRIIEIVNYANGAFQPFGLRIVLKSIVTLTSNPFSVTQSVEFLQSDFRLYEALNVTIRHDATILLTPNTLVRVLAPGLTTEHSSYTSQNGLCQLPYSNGIIADTGEPIQTAWLMAHSIGALIGLKNVEDVSGCTCPTTNGCIMSQMLDTSYKLLNWSSCSVESWQSQANAIWRSCLRDAPDAAFAPSSAGVCGNGIVEAGEQCDCGPALHCKSACCDPTTCRLRAGAECASGACCNSTTCTLRQRGQECRPSDGPCDVAETCNGTSEWCPSDDKVHDGVECDAGVSYCYNGECKSRLSQCRILYDNTSSVADSQCFTVVNSQTNVGYCHLRMLHINATNRQYQTIRCPLPDAMCGLLHCALPTRPTIGQTFDISGSSCSSNPAIDLTSSGLRSPSMTPDGASCGSSSMCVNSSCQPVSKFACSDCPDCHGNGVPTRGKLCYCKPGFAPPNCMATGCGGSVHAPCADEASLTNSVSPMPTTTAATSTPTTPTPTTTTTSTPTTPTTTTTTSTPTTPTTTTTTSTSTTPTTTTTITTPTTPKETTAITSTTPATPIKTATTTPPIPRATTQTTIRSTSTKTATATTITTTKGSTSLSTAGITTVTATRPATTTSHQFIQPTVVSPERPQISMQTIIISATVAAASFGIIVAISIAIAIKFCKSPTKTESEKHIYTDADRAGNTICTIDSGIGDYYDEANHYENETATVD